jgi:hypothetical protein
MQVLSLFKNAPHKKEEVVPSPPFEPISTPGIPLNNSTIYLACNLYISSLVITVIDERTSDKGCSNLFALTTTGSNSLSNSIEKTVKERHPKAMPRAIFFILRMVFKRKRPTSLLSLVGAGSEQMQALPQAIDNVGSRYPGLQTSLNDLPSGLPVDFD